MPRHSLTLPAVILLALAPLTAQAKARQLTALWGTTDERYALPSQMPSPPDAPSPLRLTAWRGERVSAQLVALNEAGDSLAVTLEATPPAQGVTLRGGWVEPVLADSFCDCTQHALNQYGEHLVPDRISRLRTKALAPGQLSGAWFTFFVPLDAEPGIHAGDVLLTTTAGDTLRLPYLLAVDSLTLPPPSQWAFHLDLWQNPFAVARYHGVEPWSQEHFDLMRPLMQELASAGQKTVTATLTARPWNSQTEDPFPSMVTWIKRADGTWLYDFTIFDLWVDFMASCGIDAQINCYSMIPWRLSFEYFDQATASLREVHCAPGEQLYDEFWGGMLREFRQHLSERGLLHKTNIAMDERSPQQMQSAISLIQRAAPGLGISFAGNFHPAIEPLISDYSIDYLQIDSITPELAQARRDRGQTTTFYTCCSTPSPNTFTFSPPAEACLLPQIAAERSLDGYLRWAYNSWTADPVSDSRFRAFPSGDCYIIYPNAETSIRWERLVEGIQLFERQAVAPR